MDTLWNIEAGEVYGREILETQKNLAQLEEKSAHLSYLESTNQISADELSYKRSVFHMEKESLLAKQQYLKLKKEKYEGDYPNRLIQLPITGRVMEAVLKKGLSEIQVFPKNGKGNCVNLDLRLNTHSLRKMYGDHFYNTGIRLRENDILKVDMEMLKLLQDKFMHTNMGYNPPLQSSGGRLLQNGLYP